MNQSEDAEKEGILRMTSPETSFEEVELDELINNISIVGNCSINPPNIDEDDESYVPTNPADQSISGLFSYRK